MILQSKIKTRKRRYNHTQTQGTKLNAVVILLESILALYIHSHSHYGKHAGDIYIAVTPAVITAMTGKAVTSNR